MQVNTIGLASHNLHVNDTVRLASGLLVTVVQVNDADHITLSSDIFETGDIIYSNICHIISPNHGAVTDDPVDIYIRDSLTKQTVSVRESSTNTFLVTFDLDLYFNSNAYSHLPICMFLITDKVFGHLATQRSQYYFDQGYPEKKLVFLTGENYFYITLSDIRLVDDFDTNSQVSSIATKYDLTNLQGFVLYDGIIIITRYVDNQTIKSSLSIKVSRQSIFQSTRSQLRISTKYCRGIE